MPNPFRIGILLTLVLVVGGCSKRPKAPPLSDEPVFHDEQIGLRFLAPEGWVMASRADPPAGTLPKPVVLVTYLYSKGDKPVEFELLAADLPEGTDLIRFLADYQIGPEKWAVKPGSESVIVNGTSGTRYVLTRGTGKNEYRREATAFRRGGRTYIFVVTFGTADSEHRDQARKSVESVNWTK